MKTTLLSATPWVAAASVRERIVMPVAAPVQHHNCISRPNGSSALALTTDFGPAYVDAKQAAPPREDLR